MRDTHTEIVLIVTRYELMLVGDVVGELADTSECGHLAVSAGVSECRTHKAP